MPKRDFKKHKVIWDANNRIIRIIPKNAHSTVTEPFGLGNSLIRINVAYVPKKIVQEITGDTDATKLAPADISGLRRWNMYPSSVGSASKKLTLFDGKTKDINFIQASSVDIVEAAKDVMFSSENFSEGDAASGKRVDW